MVKRWPFLACLAQLFAKRRSAMQSMFTYAVAFSQDGTRTLTVFEGRKAASIELSAEWAAELSALLGGRRVGLGSAGNTSRVFRRSRLRVFVEQPDGSSRELERGSGGWQL